MRGIIGPPRPETPKTVFGGSDNLFEDSEPLEPGVEHTARLTALNPPEIRRSHSEKEEIQRRHNLVSVRNQLILCAAEVADSHGRHARNEQYVLDTQHLDNRGQTPRHPRHARARNQRGDDPVTARISQLRLKDGDQREGATRARDRVLEDIVLAHVQLSASSAAP